MRSPNTGAESRPRPSLYNPNPEHLWNRLHEALLVRVGLDGRTYGSDRLEPLLWPRTKHLVEPHSRDGLVALLEEFIKNKGEKLVQDSLKRALLQRDLWLVFNWLAGDHDYADNLGVHPEVSRAAQQRLRGPLAAVIGRLALSLDQIEALPDNYAAAVASGEFANDYNPQQPDRPFLPDNLFATDGPWVCVGRPDGPVAPEHLGDNNLFTNSAFLVFLRLPGGRPATLDYLKRLRSFNQPPRVRPDDATRNAGYTSIPNPQLPKFSAGTQVALVRRALLVTSPPRVVPTALTESVQLRVYLKIPDLTLQTLNDAAGLDRDSNHQVRSLQSFHEFRLSRALLFAGRAGGLHAVGSHERDFKTGFRAHMDDDLEIPVTVDSRSVDARQGRIKETCIGCHNLPGVYSFNSYFSYVQGDYRGPDTGRHAALSESPPADVLGSTAHWKQTRPDWAALRILLAK